MSVSALENSAGYADRSPPSSDAVVLSRIKFPKAFSKVKNPGCKRVVRSHGGLSNAVTSSLAHRDSSEEESTGGHGRLLV